MTRREEREALFALLFEMSFSEITVAEDILEIEKAERNYDTEYILNCYHGTIEHIDEIDALIEETAQGWKLARISKVTRAILRLSIYEMLYTDIFFAVSMNEAVELAKKYDHEKAPAFVNGILNRIAEKKGLKTPKKDKNADETK